MLWVTVEITVYLRYRSRANRGVIFSSALYHAHGKPDH